MIKKRIDDENTQTLCWLVHDTKSIFFRFFWGWRETRADDSIIFAFSKRDWQLIYEYRKRLNDD